MRVNLTKANIFSRYVPNFIFGQKVAVIGSGNTVLDCARSAVRFGRDVTLMFRRTEDDMRVKKEEREFAKEEGINFEPLVRPLEILAGKNNFVGGIKCIRMDYADSNMSQKWELAEVPGSEFILDVDAVIIAVGHRPNLSIPDSTLGSFNLNDDGTIKADAETNMTSIPKVFACGNIVSNSGPLINAIGSGKKAAENIVKALK